MHGLACYIISQYSQILGVRDFIFLIAKIWRNEGALKPTKNITMGKVYMFYDHFNNYWVNLCAGARFFLSLKFRKFYLLKTRFLVIFKCLLGALRAVFRKNVRKQTPPKLAILGGVYFLTFFRKTTLSAPKWHLKITKNGVFRR